MTDRGKRFHSNSSVGRASFRNIRRSWHLFEVVSFDGCPGFKGPDPQPISMSGKKSRVGSSDRQEKGRCNEAIAATGLSAGEPGWREDTNASGRPTASSMGTGQNVVWPADRLPDVQLLPRRQAASRLVVHDGRLFLSLVPLYCTITLLHSYAVGVKFNPHERASSSDASAGGAGGARSVFGDPHVAQRGGMPIFLP